MQIWEKLPNRANLGGLFKQKLIVFKYFIIAILISPISAVTSLSAKSLWDSFKPMLHDKKHMPFFFLLSYYQEQPEAIEGPQFGYLPYSFVGLHVYWKRYAGFDLVPVQAGRNSDTTLSKQTKTW